MHPGTGAPRKRRPRIAMLRLQSLLPFFLFVPLALLGANSLAQVPEGAPNQGGVPDEQEPETPTPTPTPGDPEGDADPVQGSNGLSDELEARMARMEARLDEFGTQIDALTEGQRAIQRYLEQRAQASSALESALDRAVEQGYTAGINFESRKTLVAAWRKDLAELRTNVPGPPAAKEPDTKPSRR